MRAQWRRLPKGATSVPAHHGLGCGLRGRTAGKKGETKVSPFLSINPFPLGRAARARVSPAFRLPPGCLDKESRTGATPEMARRGRRALRSEGWSPPFLFLGENGRRKLWRYAPCARSAPLFAAANAVTLWAHTYAPAPTHRKWGDSQEGRNEVSPLLCACRAQRHRLPGRALRAPTVMRIYFVPRRAVAHLPPPRHRLQGKVVFLW